MFKGSSQPWRGDVESVLSEIELTDWAGDRNLDCFEGG